MGSLFGDEGLLDKQDGMTTRASAQDQLYIRKNQPRPRGGGSPAPGKRGSMNRCLKKYSFYVSLCPAKQRHKLLGSHFASRKSTPDEQEPA